ncbi:MAG TPA: flotillin domain-containing protein [Fimbriimonadaceae bacterium]|nr:flotillin domain-containing protein [Fimbriimonadaceae bacterium]HRJ34255.1 flotillin domain-containing protein [Fimbriimonadaceae bacterium]
MPDQTTIQLVAIAVGLVLLGIFVIGIIFSRLFVRATKETSFVRTGLGGQRVVMNGGAIVLPVVHETIRVNMNTLRLPVERGRDSALITKDRVRVDVQAEFFVRVKPTEDAIADAAQTLGQRTMEPGALKELVEGKFVDALRAVAAEMTMEELHEQRVQFVQRVQTTVSEDILKNGLELESVSLTSLDQTGMEFLNPNNAFDAQGLAKLTETIELKRKERNDIEQTNKVAIQERNLDATRNLLALQKEEEYAKLEQEREVSIRKAQQAAEIAQVQAARQQEAKQAEINASQQISQTEIASKRKIEEDRIQTERELEELNLQKQKALETSQIDKTKALELAEQERAIAIAEKSRAKSEAEALAAEARAQAVRAEEQVITVKEREMAERRKIIELVQAAEEAEREALKVTVAAEAERKANEDRAAALEALARGEGEAERLRAEAARARYAVDAEGRRLLNEAENLLNPDIIAAQVKKILIERLPEIIRESVKPMEQIEGIKIIQVEGLTGGGSSSLPGDGSSNGSSNGSLADQLVNSALRYRGQAPLVDALMSEIGMKGGDLNGMGQAVAPDAKPDSDSKS